MQEEGGWGGLPIGSAPAAALYIQPCGVRGAGSGVRWKTKLAVQSVSPLATSRNTARQQHNSAVCFTNFA